MVTFLIGFGVCLLVGLVCFALMGWCVDWFEKI